MNREALPPLLRGLGTLLILIASALAVLVERQEERRLSAAVARVEADAAARGAIANPRDAQLAALTREVRLLRRRLGDEDLVDRVFENPWFQLLGLLGTALLASSFLVEAWQKRRLATDPEHATSGEP